MVIWKLNDPSLYLFIYINRIIIYSLRVAMPISMCYPLYSCIKISTHTSMMQRLILPPEAYGHRSCDKSPCKAPKREDGDNNCPDQSHLVVLQLDVPPLQECLIDKRLNKLCEKIRRSTIKASLRQRTVQWLELTLITVLCLSLMVGSCTLKLAESICCVSWTLIDDFQELFVDYISLCSLLVAACLNETMRMTNPRHK